jgi:hypothetical protein
MKSDCLANPSGSQSKVWAAFSRLNAGIVGLNPTQGIDVCIMCIYPVYVSFCV